MGEGGVFSTLFSLASSLSCGTKFALKRITDGLRHELPPQHLIQMVYPVATITSFIDVAGSRELRRPMQAAPGDQRIRTS